jgi:hypothetical protein
MGSNEDELPPLELDVERLLDTLNRHRVEYIVVGGTALVIYGSVDRVTYDVDLVPANTTANLRRLGAALRDLDARVITGWNAEASELTVEPSPLEPSVFQDNPFLHLLTEAGRVDVLLAPTGVPGGYGQLIDRTNSATVGTSEILLASLDDLVAMKRAVDRAKDRDDLERIDAGAGRPPRQPPSVDPPESSFTEEMQRRLRGSEYDRDRDQGHGRYR